MDKGRASNPAGIVALASHALSNRAGVPWVALLLLFCACVPVWPQTSSSTGAVEGWVVDASHASVVNAHVEARNQETGLTRSIESDARGYYRVGELPVGPLHD